MKTNSVSDKDKEGGSDGIAIQIHRGGEGGWLAGVGGVGSGFVLDTEGKECREIIQVNIMDGRREA